ncbi:MAG: hypothetical protein ACQGVK_05685 [Myxococcota bacterium]
MLAFIGLLLFALMGVSALALDVGVAELAQKRLEVASEFVALEDARGSSDEKVRTRVGEILAVGPDRPGARLGLGPVAPLSDADPGCAGRRPEGSDGVAVLAQRVPLLFGHGSMIAFASSTSWGEILDARNDASSPGPTPVLPDSATPPDRLALRERGVCVEGRARVSLVPALAVASRGARTLPGTDLGLTLLAGNANLLWQTRGTTAETSCLPTAQGGLWFELGTVPGEACQSTDVACTHAVSGEVARIGSSPGDARATLVPAAEPLEPELHRPVVVSLRDASETVIGFATLCLRRADARTFVAFRWNDAATPLTSFTPELHDPATLDRWRTGSSGLHDRDEACRHPIDSSLRCFVQSAVLAPPEVSS